MKLKTIEIGPRVNYKNCNIIYVFMFVKTLIQSAVLITIQKH